MQQHLADYYSGKQRNADKGKRETNKGEKDKEVKTLGSNETPKDTQAQEQKQTAEERKKKALCFNCGEVGHYA